MLYSPSVKIFPFQFQPFQGLKKNYYFPFEIKTTSNPFKMEAFWSHKRVEGVFHIIWELGLNFFFFYDIFSQNSSISKENDIFSWENPASSSIFHRQVWGGRKNYQNFFPLTASHEHQLIQQDWFFVVAPLCHLGSYKRSRSGCSWLAKVLSVNMKLSLLAPIHMPGVGIACQELGGALFWNCWLIYSIVPNDTKPSCLGPAWCGDPLASC